METLFVYGNLSVVLHFHGIVTAASCLDNVKNIISCVMIFILLYFTSIKYLPYISLNAIPLLLPIKKTPRMAPPYIDWRDIRMTIVSIVSVTSCQISFLFIAEQRSHKNFKSFVIYKDLCYNFFVSFAIRLPNILFSYFTIYFGIIFAFDKFFGD